MGIPSYFRWISEKYPRIMVDCVEHLIMTSNMTEPMPPTDISPPNPNGVEFDNLYLDMNGIIHPCTHPEDGPAPTTEAAMFVAVNAYIDRIMAIVRPRKVLYMAIDGVAPRAKINQQRSRRFRAAKEMQHKAREAQALKREWEMKGIKVAALPDSAALPANLPKQLAPCTTGTVNKPSGDEDEFDDGTPFDSNVITPGTPFMERLAISLKEFVAERVASTPGWQNIRIIFSDASVPGEGEHKIAEWIRVERAIPGYDPNVKHVLYGLDADLIMLALATHEVHFSVLREEVFPKNGGHRVNGGQPNGSGWRPGGGTTAETARVAQIDTIMAAASVGDGPAGTSIRTRAELGGKKPFHFLHISILREYLENEFLYDIEREIASAAADPQPDAPEEPIVFDLENVIDDFVFLCFFVGNDFLPHLPTLDIREGAVDYLMEVYKTDLANVGYLTSGSGDVDFTRVKRMLSRIGRKEDEVFQERKSKEIQSANRAADDKRRSEALHERIRSEREQRNEGGGDGVGSAAASTSQYARFSVSSPAPMSTPIAPLKGKPTPFSMKGSAPQAPDDADLLELGDKDKNKRVGDGSTNKAAAAKLKRALKQKMAGKSGKTTSTLSAGSAGTGGSKLAALGVSSPGVVKKSPGLTGKSGSALSTATVAVAAGGSEEVLGEKKEGTKLEKEEEKANAMKMANHKDVAASPMPIVEKSVTDFEEELKNRLRAQNEIENPTDDVRLGEDGWKDRYYKHKFNWGPGDSAPKGELLHAYIEGLHWVMKYYYVGCVSWVWYYPHHYAPFASDIVGSATSTDMIHLELGKPFRPFTQLQAVMPASSGLLVLPPCYSRLMTDPQSPIIDYYPDEFEIDLNGKRFAWQGVALLPFIDENRLDAALDSLEPLLTGEERKRNSFGEAVVMAHRASTLGSFVKSIAERTVIPEIVAEGQLFGTLEPRTSLGPNGLAVVACFEMPPPRPHCRSLLPGAEPGMAVLDIASKAESAHRGGWKPARFGSLGRAARELAESRNYRLSGGPPPKSSSGGQFRQRGGGRSSGNGGRGGSGASGAKSYHQTNAGHSAQGQAQAGASAMFGGLGVSPPAPSWMQRQASTAQPAALPQWQQLQQVQQRPYQQQQQQYSNYGHGGMQYQQHQAGGYHGYQVQSAWSRGTEASSGYSQYGQQYQGVASSYTQYGSGAGATEAGGYNFSHNPSAYTLGDGGGGGGGGGGLAGPAAMQMRQGSQWGAAYSAPVAAPAIGPSLNMQGARGRSRSRRRGRGRGNAQ
jgi:5'-3' exoribonuclease 2